MGAAFLAGLGDRLLALARPSSDAGAPHRPPFRAAHDARSGATTLYRGWRDAVARVRSVRASHDDGQRTARFAGVGGVPIHWRRSAPATPPRGVVADRRTATRSTSAATRRRRASERRAGSPSPASTTAATGARAARAGIAATSTSWSPTCARSPTGRRSGGPDVPRVLFGHSMGGLIGFLLPAAHPDTVRAGALSAPALRLPPRARAGSAGSRACSARSRRACASRTELDETRLSRDPAVGAAYVADPLVHRKATAGFVRALHCARRRTVAEAATAAARAAVDPARRRGSVGATRPAHGESPRGSRARTSS